MVNSAYCRLLVYENENNPPSLSDAFISVSPALSYITQNYHKEISVNDLAKTCNLSETHFRVLFKKAIGRSPLQHLTYIRMKMAKTLLKSTGLPILLVAQSVGFESISSFNRTFKTQFGQPHIGTRAKRTANPLLEHVGSLGRVLPKLLHTGEMHKIIGV